MSTEPQPTPPAAAETPPEREQVPIGERVTLIRALMEQIEAAGSKTALAWLLAEDTVHRAHLWPGTRAGIAQRSAELVEQVKRCQEQVGQSINHTRRFKRAMERFRAIDQALAEGRRPPQIPGRRRRRRRSGFKASP